MEKLSELRSKFEGEAFKLFIGGSTAGNACSMQRYKFEKNIFKLLIGGSTASKPIFFMVTMRRERRIYLKQYMLPVLPSHTEPARTGR